MKVSERHCIAHRDWGQPDREPFQRGEMCWIILTRPDGSEIAMPGTVTGRSSRQRIWVTVGRTLHMRYALDLRHFATHDADVRGAA